MEDDHGSEKTIMVWLDDDTTRSDCRSKILDEIRSYYKDKDARLFHDPDQCLDFVTDLPEAPRVLLLITSQQLIEGTLPLILDIPQIKLIYKCCLNDLTSNSDRAANDRTIFERPSKVRDIVDLLMSSLLGLPEDLSWLRNNNLPFELRFGQLASTLSTRKRPTNQHSILFVYMRIFYRILLRYDQTDSDARYDMLNYLRQKFKDNPKQLIIIDQFDQTFPSTLTAIEWYKRPTFHHEIINEALFNQDRMVLYKMRFFIRQLDHELMKLYDEQQWAQKQNATIVYRGTCMAIHQVVQCMGQGPDAVQHFDNFLSTSRDPLVGRLFAQSASESSEFAAVLLEVTIPPLSADAGVFRCPFADVVLPGNEEVEAEILFSAGAMFRMGKVEMTGRNPHPSFTIPLTLTHDLDFDDEQIKNLILYLRRKYNQIPSALLALSHLMLEMGDHDRAEEFINQLIHQSVTANHLTGPAFSLLGQMYIKQEDYVRAFYVLEQALKYLSLDDRCSLSDTWAALGQVHLRRNDFDQALAYARKALESASTPEQIILRHIEFSIIHREKGECNEAESHLSKAHDQLKLHLPGKHPTWIEYYKQMGQINLAQEKTNEAQFMFFKALSDLTMILPSQQLTIVSIGQQMAGTYERMGDSTMAEMFSAITVMIAQDLSKHHKAVQEAEQQFIGIFPRLMNPSPEESETL
jgi:tetratricopeptide (TPR) repeat protein